MFVDYTSGIVETGDKAAVVSQRYRALPGMGLPAIRECLVGCVVSWVSPASGGVHFRLCSPAHPMGTAMLFMAMEMTLEGLCNRAKAQESEMSATLPVPLSEAVLLCAVLLAALLVNAMATGSLKTPLNLVEIRGDLLLFL